MSFVLAAFEGFHPFPPNVEALLSGVALAAMQLNKDKQMPC
jgi:hypothetical protein